MNIFRILFKWMAATLLAILLFPPLVMAQHKTTPQPAAELEEQQDTFPTLPGLQEDVYNQLKVFFLLVQRGKVDAAYESLVKGTVIETRPNDITVLRDKTRQAIQLFGEIRGYEILEMSKVGEHLVNVVVLSLGEKYPLRWKLYFYDSRNAWRLIDIRVDERLSNLFGEEESAVPAPK